MLQPGATVRALIPTRVMSFSENVRDSCGRKELEWLDSITGACTMICPLLPTLLGCGKQVKCKAFYLDNDRVATAKKEAAAAGGVPCE